LTLLGKQKKVDGVEPARYLFDEAANSVAEILDLLSPAQTGATAALAATATYRPNSAFLMMAIDDKLPDLEDVKNGIKHVCKEFGITAIRADEIHASKHSRIGPKNPKNSVHAQIVGKPETAPVPAWLSPPARLQGM
jgi:hypothetical protein